MELPIKALTHAPADKLLEGLVLILPGGRATSQANLLLRPNLGLACAWGQEQFAEQSTLSDTFDALSDSDVDVLCAGFASMTQSWSQVCRHDFRRGGWILGGDLTGLPASRPGQPEGILRGQKSRYGRQVARVTVEPYGECLGSLLFPGAQKSKDCLQPMVLRSRV
jgi:hypothetical protein